MDQAAGNTVVLDLPGGGTLTIPLDADPRPYLKAFGMGMSAGEAAVADDSDDLESWWVRVAKEDLAAIAPKVTEYGGTSEGSADLRIMGYALSELRMPPGAPPEVQQEVACWFYALGKIARLISDYNQGKAGKADTWMDLEVYAKMARRLQAVGRWP